MEDASGAALRARVPAGSRRILVAATSSPSTVELFRGGGIAEEAFAVTFVSGAEERATPLPARDSWDGFFDAILFPRVFEHLEDPSEALVRVRPWLAPEGRVIASIENAGSAAVVGGLLAGRFEGGLTGIPRRLFTRKTVEDLFEACDYEIASIDAVPAELSADEGALVEKLRSLPGASPDLEASAFLIVARAGG